ncbi:hypothetical protein [Polaromonas sp. CG9_12]|nr:hypothetical protein [Polaromonas sp. CG9_12]
MQNGIQIIQFLSNKKQKLPFFITTNPSAASTDINMTLTRRTLGSSRQSQAVMLICIFPGIATALPEAVMGGVAAKS